MSDTESDDGIRTTQALQVYMILDHNTMREVMRLLFLWIGTSLAECPLDESDWKVLCDTALQFPQLRRIDINCLYSGFESQPSADCERACENLRDVLQDLNRIVNVAPMGDLQVRTTSNKCHLVHSLSLLAQFIPRLLRKSTAYKSPWMDIAEFSNAADCVTCRW